MNIPRNRRVLIVDDNADIHQDFRKVLGQSAEDAAGDESNQFTLRLDELDSLFGDVPDRPVPAEPYEIDSAYSGHEALSTVQSRLAKGQPYAVAFVDVRMPPGWDGVETVRHLWKADPELQVVICTAYSDYSWQQIRQALGETDQLLILRKPFDAIEVQQLAAALSEKWGLSQMAKRNIRELEQLVAERSSAFQCALNIAMDAIPTMDARDMLCSVDLLATKPQVPELN